MKFNLPTKKEDFYLIFVTIRLVLSIPKYLFLSLIIAFLSLTIFTVSQNLDFFFNSILGGFLPLENRLILFLELFPLIGAFYNISTGILLILLSVFIGINISLVVYHIFEHEFSASSGSVSLLGIVFGFLGAGCAACGSVLLLGILSLFGATSLILLLPFHGIEVSFIAFIALFLSTYWIADGMREGEIAGCPIDI